MGKHKYPVLAIKCLNCICGRLGQSLMMSPTQFASTMSSCNSAYSMKKKKRSLQGVTNNHASWAFQ